MTYLFPEELIVLIDPPRGEEVYGGQHSSAEHCRPHPHGQQRVDDVDEEDGPPDPLRGAAGGHHQHPEHLHHD